MVNLNISTIQQVEINIDWEENDITGIQTQDILL